MHQYTFRYTHVEFLECVVNSFPMLETLPWCSPVCRRGCPTPQKFSSAAQKPLTDATSRAKPSRTTTATYQCKNSMFSFSFKMVFQKMFSQKLPKSFPKKKRLKVFLYRSSTPWCRSSSQSAFSRRRSGTPSRCAASETHPGPPSCHTNLSTDLNGSPSPRPVQKEKKN